MSMTLETFLVFGKRTSNEQCRVIKSGIDHRCCEGAMKEAERTLTCIFVMVYRLLRKIKENKRRILNVEKFGQLKLIKLTYT